MEEKSLDKLKKLILATILNVLVAFLLSIIILLIIKVTIGQKIDEVFTLVNYISIDTNENQRSEVIVDKEEGIKNYPEYGEKYAQIVIEKIGVNLPVYFGDTLEILKNGVGHSSGSYFPGEGGSIIYMGHNSKQVFRRVSELEVGDNVKVITEYGEYNYKIYDMKLIKETELEQLPIQSEEEILMIYTCYPFNNIGYTTERYVIYAKLV